MRFQSSLTTISSSAPHSQHCYCFWNGNATSLPFLNVREQSLDSLICHVRLQLYKRRKNPPYLLPIALSTSSLSFWAVLWCHQKWHRVLQRCCFLANFFSLHSFLSFFIVQFHVVLIHSFDSITPAFVVLTNWILGIHPSLCEPFLNVLTEWFYFVSFIITIVSLYYKWFIMFIRCSNKTFLGFNLDQLVKCFPCKPEDLSSIPRVHLRKPMWWYICTYHLTTGGCQGE